MIGTGHMLGEPAIRGGVRLLMPTNQFPEYRPCGSNLRAAGRLAVDYLARADTSSPVTLLTTLVGLALAFAGPHLVPKLLTRVGIDDTLASAGADDVLISDCYKWLAAVALLGWVVAVEGRPPGSLTGRRLDPAVFLGVVVAGVVGMFAVSAAIPVVFDRLGLGGIEATMEQLGDRSVGAILVTAVTAGITEELLYRGYAIERLIEVTGSPLFAGALSVVAFGVAHYGEYWERDQTLQITLSGAVLVGLYLLTRSLPALIAIHAIHDTLGMLLTKRYGDPDAG